jgi:starch phosphorylase
MEYGLKKGLPIYSGGLGILAGDTLKSAADLKLPLSAVGLLYRDGYFRQKIINGQQENLPDMWDPAKHPELIDLKEEVQVEIGGKKVTFRLWGHEVKGFGGGFVPLILLDSLGYPNPVGLEDITRNLYPGNEQTRLFQEMALGIGGMRAMAKLRLPVSYHHLNEGDAAFAPLESLRTLGKEYANLSPEDLNAVRKHFSFTTHTPVPAGLVTFRSKMVETAFSEAFLRAAVLDLGRDPKNPDYINMAYLAMTLSEIRNGVSQLHARTSEKMFPDYVPIISITNGVHHLTWTSDPLARLYDEFCPEWRKDPTQLKKLKEVDAKFDFRKKLWEAHLEAKAELLRTIKERSGAEFDKDVFTIGFARRFAGYKRGDLIFSDPEELLKIAEEKGALQIVFAGKAHPHDGIGKGILADVIKKGRELTQRSNGKIKVVFLEGYDIDLGKLIASGVDIWLNNPIPPNEASGTSGMKAALNAVPQVSTWDGWWVEGARKDAAGWTIGKDVAPDQHASALYQVTREVAAAYYNRETDPTFMDKMIGAAAENGSYFNTHRMDDEYFEKVWPPERLLSVSPQVQIEPSLPPEIKLLNLSDITPQITQAESRTDIESIAAKALNDNLRRCFRVGLYKVRNDAVRISRRWFSIGFGKTFDEENRPDFGKSKFKDWRTLQDFQGEVMGDLLHSGKIQIVSDPANDPRCYRDKELVSDNPFILVPEIVNGVIIAVYKIDFRPPVELEKSFEKEFTEKLIKHVGLNKERLYKKELDEDMAKIETPAGLISWVLTLMTAGGFVDMPRYAAETNRAAFFEYTGQRLKGRLAVGDTSWDEHNKTLNNLSNRRFSEGIKDFLRKRDPSDFSLSQRIEGVILGENAITGPILMKFGMPSYDAKDFSGSFDSQKLSALKDKTEKLFWFSGHPVEEYLLLPVFGSSPEEFLGLVYVDNAFSKTPLSIEKYRDLVSAFGKYLARMGKK